jgi:hypothetical protein
LANGRLARDGPPYTPELANRLADHINWLTDEEAAKQWNISWDCINRWRKGNREFCERKKAETQRPRRRLTRIEAEEQGWQGTAWVKRIYPHRFARPEVESDAVVNQEAKPSRVIVLPAQWTLVRRPGYHQSNNGDLERREGTLVYVLVRRQNNSTLIGE